MKWGHFNGSRKVLSTLYWFQKYASLEAGLDEKHESLGRDNRCSCRALLFLLFSKVVILNEPVALDQLSCLVCGMARKEEQVSRLNIQCKLHKHERVKRQGYPFCINTSCTEEANGNQGGSPQVILPEIMSGDFWVSAMAARGSPQLATGPQKCVLLPDINEFFHFLKRNLKMIMGIKGCVNGFEHSEEQMTALLKPPMTSASSHR